MDFLNYCAASFVRGNATLASVVCGQPRRRGMGVAATASLVLLWFFAGLPLLLHAQGQPAGSLEYPVKAAFLLNFTKFAEWPAAAFGAADSPIRICVTGVDPFGLALDRTAAGESVNGRAVRVERLPEGAVPRGCHILFISRSERGSLDLIFSELRGSSTLTVSELPGFTRLGGMIEFLIEDGKVRFYINAAAADAASVKLSSRLLRVAKEVRGAG